MPSGEALLGLGTSAALGRERVCLHLQDGTGEIMILKSMSNGLLWCIVLSAPSMACSGEPTGQSETDSGFGTNNSELVGVLNPNAQSRYWNDGVGQSAIINVCWTKNALAGKDIKGVTLGSSFPGIANTKAWVQEAVENGWGRAANLAFVGGDQQSRLLVHNRLWNPRHGRRNYGTRGGHCLQDHCGKDVARTRCVHRRGQGENIAILQLLENAVLW
jgi:hypothetical protein